MDIEFEDIFYTVGSDFLPWNKGPRREILKGVSGCFRTKELSAILGPSGAGKTSLLNALSGYKLPGIRGRLLLNGQPRDERKFRKMSCYITQEDQLRALLSVDELMLFASSLKLPSEYSAKDRINIIRDIQNKLGLFEARNTLTENLSGGQRKRLSVALELINNPPILFLDEPTSGLDNVAAGYLLRLLSSLSRGGKTIVCTIHQPSASIFSLFDQAYFVADGRCVYQGGTGPHLLEYLQARQLPCPEYYNPADYIIELVEEEKNIEILSRGSENGKVVWYSKNRAILEATRTEALTTETTTLLQYSAQTKKEKSPSCHPEKMSFWIQFSALLSYMFLQQKRNKINLWIQICHNIGCGIALGTMFYKKGSNGSEFMNNVNFCIGVVVFQTYTYSIVQVLSYPMEVKLLKKEHFNHWYGLFPYYAAFTASRVPLNTLLSLAFLTIVYVLTGFPWEIHRFLAFASIGIMTAFVSEALGLTVGSIFSMTNGAAVGPLTLAPLLGFAVYGVDFAHSISPFMNSLVRISFMRAGFFGLILVFFGLGREQLECDDPIFCYFSDPKVVLYYLDLEEKSIWSYIMDLFLILIVFRFAFYLGLKWRLRK